MVRQDFAAGSIQRPVYRVRGARRCCRKSDLQFAGQREECGNPGFFGITQGRDELKTLLDFLREGDELVVTRVDRLARSIRDLQNIVYELDQKGVTLSATEQPIDTRTSAGKCFLDMLSVFAEFETNLRKERQMEGIAKAKERGVYKGRKPSVDVEKVRELKAEGLGASAIAKQMGIGRASVYRALGS